MKRLNRLGMVCAVAAALVAAGAGTKPPVKLHYLQPDSIDVAQLLPPPPGAETAEAKADMQAVLTAQSTRTEVEAARAAAEKALTPDAFISVTGSWFSAKNLPKTYALLDAASTESKYFSAAGKDYFARPRPMKASGVVKPSISGEEEPSYPSGHATRGMMFAILLSDAMPDLKAQLIARGEEIGWDRVIAGVHYPSDLVAGRVLAQELVRKLMANAEFAEQWKIARAEIEAARHAEPAAVGAR